MDGCPTADGRPNTRFEAHEVGGGAYFRGDCLAVMRQLLDDGHEGSVDSIVTDPPYHLTSGKKGGSGPASANPNTPAGRAMIATGFMGKAWDGGDVAFQKETWELALRLLKPGGHRLAFGGSRTYHRLACAVEDAGFEIRDQVMWLYGCLSEDTQCLMSTGWKDYTSLTTADRVMQWNHASEDLSWTNPEEVMIYPYSGPMVNLVNRHTDQMLTPNHRVHAMIRRHSRNAAPTVYEVNEADALKRCWQIDLPMSGKLEGDASITGDQAYLVGWWLTDAWKHRDGKAVMFSQCKPDTMARLKAALEPHGYSEYVETAKKDAHSDEHTFYVTGKVAAWLIKDFPNRELTWDVLSWSYEARHRLFNGPMDGDGSAPSKQSAQTFWSKKQDRRDVFVALALSLGYRAYDDPENFGVNVNMSTGTTQLQAVHRVEHVPYDGNVWCVRVPDGAFVVRRKRRPFITGNSGSP